MDVDDWIGKIEQKFIESANYYPIKQTRIIYVDSLIKYPALLYLMPWLKSNAINKFTIAKKKFEALCAAYGNTDKKHIICVKF